MLSSITVGVLVSRVDTRQLIGAGFVIFGLTSYWTSKMSLQLSFGSLFWPIPLSGTALGLIFVPLSGTALGTLLQEQLGNGVALFNLIRNIGGSTGADSGIAAGTAHRVIVFLAREDARFINGVILPVDGGLHASNGQPNYSHSSAKAEFRQAQKFIRVSCSPVLGKGCRWLRARVCFVLLEVHALN
jgi:hypothetical protein